MTGFRLWGLAQLINAIVSVIIWQDVGLIICVFCVVGGLPAILLFSLWMHYIENNDKPARQNYISTLVWIPILTAICGLGLAVVLDQGQTSLFAFAIAPVCSAFLATAIMGREIKALSYRDETDYNNQNLTETNDQSI